MTQDEQLTQTIYRFILRTFAQSGNPPSPGEIADAMNLPGSAEADRHLAALEAQGAIYRDPTTGDLLTAYPFSATPTSHRVRLGENRHVHAMCAVDALGIPFLLDADATIHSECAQCGTGVSVRVAAGRITAATDGLLVVYTVPRDQCCAATDQCPFINFFCSLAHAQAWQARHPQLITKTWGLPEALAYGKTVFEHQLRGDDPGPLVGLNNKE